MRRELARRTRGLDRLPDSVWKRTGALNTWGTNAVEGNTLTQEEVERLVLEQRSVSGRPVPDVLETIQHEAAFRGLLQRRAKPISLVTVLELHEAVFRLTGIARVGQWRLSNPYIGGTRYRPPRRDEVIPRMTAWERELHRRDAAKEDAVATAAWMHHEFEAVHPFEDGNGRIGRLVLNLHLLRSGWPPVHVTPADRDEYLAALEKGHARDYGPLERFLRVRLARSMLDLLDQVGGPKDRLEPLAAFEGKPWNPYGVAYMSLRARQGALAAIPATHTSAMSKGRSRHGRPRWLTSERALRAYVRAMGVS